MGIVGDTVLVTGATGFLGGHLIRHLARTGVNVIAMGRDAEKCAALRAQGYQTICHDLSTAVPLNDSLEQVNAVVHCAALSAASGPRRAFEMANVVATRNIVSLAQRLGVYRFVHISSPTVYFKMADALSVREDMVLPKPINAYAETKQMAERIVAGAPDIDPIILRPRGIYGPGDTTLLPTLLRAAKRPLPLLRKGEARIDLTYVDDVIAAIVAALAAGPDANGQPFNISGGEVLAVRDIVERTCRAYGTTATWRTVPLAPALALARVLELTASALPHLPQPAITRYSIGLFAYAQSLDISKAHRLLGWQPEVPFDEGLRRTRAAVQPL
ncbi:NAD(P)-dependent oxidoreductase [uncultured Tateyamaria sp.]|uniref:NAD-dependent epimerase/dehydratase family protein n=1 Tax=uncultured Tateyamaria sp. TaxID=455651 RepID=UPI002603584E|nr:NAD(P)-dependent oxidoreductase [uncultured Tateyamaria sp.]